MPGRSRDCSEASSVSECSELRHGPVTDARQLCSLDFLDRGRGLCLKVFQGVKKNRADVISGERLPVFRKAQCDEGVTPRYVQ